jgi:hypothetical protein
MRSVKLLAMANTKVYNRILAMSARVSELLGSELTTLAFSNHFFLDISHFFLPAFLTNTLLAHLDTDTF